MSRSSITQLTKLRLFGVCLLLGAAGAPYAAPAQQKALSPRDSARRHQEAVMALRRFENQLALMEGRSRQFRKGPSETIFGACEISVADYCYGPRNGAMAFGGFGTTRASGRFRATRYEMLDQRRQLQYITRYLDTLTALFRDGGVDRFISSELVRAEIERGNVVKAYENVSRCRAEEWWCNALRAYVIHLSGQWTKADTAWERTLAAMPPVELCTWLDPTWVSNEKEFVRNYRSKGCEERIRMAHRVWWLSDPLYSIDGNERRSEHLMRLVDLVLAEGFERRRQMTPAMLRRSDPIPSDSSILEALDSRRMLRNPPWRMLWGFGYDELVMRVGVPHYLVSTFSDDGRTIAQYPFPRMSFVPHSDVFIDFLKATPDHWKISDPYAFEFMNGWPWPMYGIPYQMAWFRRGDSARVVAATDVSADSVLRPLKFRADLILQKDFDRPALVALGRGEPVYRFGMTAPRDSTLASIELVAPNLTSGRARFGTGMPSMPDQRVTMSDVLLVHAGQRTPATIDEAERIALGSTSFRSGDIVGLFWEMYGLLPGERARITVVAERERGSLLGGLVRSMFSGQTADSVGVQWEEAATPGRPIEPGTVNLSLSSLAAGEYTLSVAVDVPGQQRVNVKRRIEIVRNR